MYKIYLCIYITHSRIHRFFASIKWSIFSSVSPIIYIAGQWFAFLSVIDVLIMTRVWRRMWFIDQNKRTWNCLYKWKAMKGKKKKRKKNTKKNTETCVHVSRREKFTIISDDKFSWRLARVHSCTHVAGETLWKFWSGRSRPRVLRLNFIISNTG